MHIYAFNKEIAVFLGIEYLEMHTSIQSYQYSTLRLVSNIGRDKGTEGKKNKQKKTSKQEIEHNDRLGSKMRLYKQPTHLLRVPRRTSNLSISLHARHHCRATSAKCKASFPCQKYQEKEKHAPRLSTLGLCWCFTEQTTNFTAFSISPKQLESIYFAEEGIIRNKISLK